MGFLVSASPQYPVGVAAPEEPAVYSYNYAVNDDYTGTSFQANEAREGVPTSGSYSVALPDGRTQTVTYSVADGYSGYVADVSYSGEAQYPDTPAYKPVAASAYTPAQVVVKPVAPVYKPTPVYPATFVKPAAVYHPAPAARVYHPAPVVVKHAAPVYHPAPVVVKHVAPVYHKAPVYQAAPVYHSTPVYHSAPVVVRPSGYKAVHILKPAKKVFKSKIKYNTF